MNSDLKQNKRLASQKFSLVSSSNGLVKKLSISDKNLKKTKKISIDSKNTLKENRFKQILTVNNVRNLVKFKNFDNPSQRKKKKRLKIRVYIF